MARDSGAMPISCHTTIADTTNEATIASDASPPETPFGRRRPEVALMTKPTSGKSGISASTTGVPRSKGKGQRSKARARISPFQRREGVGVERFAVTEERNHDGQADRRLR